MRVHNCLSSPANLLLILSVLTKLKLFLQCSGIYSLYRMFICVYFYRKQFLQLLWENDHDGIRVPFPNCFLSKILQLQLQNVLGFWGLVFLASIFSAMSLVMSETQIHGISCWKAWERSCFWFLYPLEVFCGKLSRASDELLYWDEVEVIGCLPL